MLLFKIHIGSNMVYQEPLFKFHACFYRTLHGRILGENRKQHPAETSPVRRQSTQAHTSNTYQLPQFTLCVGSHVKPHLPTSDVTTGQISIFLPPLLNNSQTPTLQTPLKQASFRCFEDKVQHLHSSINTFVNH